MHSDLFSWFPLRKPRVHETCGSGAPAFAALSAASAPSEVLWIRQAWQPEMINPLGLSAYIDPSRLLLAQVRNQIEGLTAMEEALRDGSLSLVMIELTESLDLKAGRRLQLAAKAGGAPGLCLIPEGMGSNAAETRWHCTPLYNPDDSTLQRWNLIKNKSGTLGAWHVRWEAASRRLHVVSPPGERPGASALSP